MFSNNQIVIIFISSNNLQKQLNFQVNIKENVIHIVEVCQITFHIHWLDFRQPRRHETGQEWQNQPDPIQRRTNSSCSSEWHGKHLLVLHHSCSLHVHSSRLQHGSKLLQDFRNFQNCAFVRLFDTGILKVLISLSINSLLITHHLIMTKCSNLGSISTCRHLKYLYFMHIPWFKFKVLSFTFT